MARFSDFTAFNCLNHLAALVVNMRAICVELAVVDIRFKFPEAKRQILFINLFAPLDVEGRKAGRVRNIAAIRFKQLAVARGVFTSAKLLTRFAGFKLKVGENLIKKRRLANACVAAKKQRFCL